MPIAQLRPHMRTVLLALSFLAVLARSQVAGAECPSFTVTSAAQICPPEAVTCVVSQTFCIADNSILDFGNSELDFAHGGQFALPVDGSVTIRAGNVNLMAVGGPCAILGPGADVSIDSTGDVTVGRVGSTFACIDVSGDPGGSIAIDALEDTINIQGVLDTHETGVSDIQNDGVSLSARQVTVDSRAEIDVSGTTVSSGGEVNIDATATITIRGTIQGNGNDNGGVALTSSEGDIDTTDAIFQLQGQGGGPAGPLSIDAGGTAI